MIEAAKVTTHDDRFTTNSCADAAHAWFDFGLNVIPVENKVTAPKWQKWLDNLSHASITKHWNKNPTHELGAIVDSNLFILDADSPEARTALLNIEGVFDIAPSIIVKTTKGEHHYFRKAPDTYAITRGYSSKDCPQKIDIRTGRTELDGRSMIVLPPSKGKELDQLEAGCVDELSEVDQAFIDAVFQHNGEDPPRPIEPNKRSTMRETVGGSKAAKILSYISPNLGYNDWLTVLMGLHHEFRGSEEGSLLIDDWSSGGDSYPGSEEIEYKWNTFALDRGITFASVAKMAADAGADLSEIARSYNPDGTKRKTYEDLMAEAQALTKGDSEKVDTLVAECVHLKSVQKRRIYEVIKKHAGLPLSVLKDAEKEAINSTTPELDDLDIAKELIKEIGEENVLAVPPGVYHWQDSGVWQRQDDRSVKQWVQHFIPDKVDAVSKGKVESVSDLFRTEIFAPDHEFNVGPTDCVNVLNGELHLADAAWTLQSHNHQHYRTTQLPVAFDPKAKAPLFNKFLREIFAGDYDAADKIKALMEMIGYTLMAHCRHEKFIILVGSGANGKSVLLAVLEALCGPENVAGVQPSMFDRSFQRAHLHGKLANIVTEIKQGEIIDDASLKGITSGEPTTVEHKFKDPFVMRPFSTCWFGTNHMPHTRDFSDALFRRALVVEFNRVFKPELGNCDDSLKDKLFTELPGILNLALYAYAEAQIVGFTMPESCIAARDKWRLEADQVAQFVEDECESCPDSIGIGELFRAYSQWALDNGIHKTLGKKGFRDRLTRLGFGEDRTNSTRFVTGIRFTRGYF